MSKLKVGIVGFGGIGPVHLNAYRRNAGIAEVIAVADVDKERLQIARDVYGIKNCYVDYKDIFELRDIDIIDVCIPTHKHHEVVMTAAGNKKHVFCEKPMALTLKEAYEMRDECKKANVKLQLGFVRRYDNQWLKMKDIVEEGSLGHPVLWRSASASSGPAPDWYMHKNEGEGPFVDTAIHNYDFGNFMFGMVKSVSANGIVLRPNGEVVDTGVVEISYASGDKLQLMWSWGLVPGAGAGAGKLHDMIGHSGAMEIPVSYKALGQKKEIEEHTEYLVIKKQNNQEEIVEFVRNDAFADQMKSFLNCIVNDTAPEVSANEGIESLKVALAVLESFKNNKPVYMI